MKENEIVIVTKEIRLKNWTLKQTDTGSVMIFKGEPEPQNYRGTIMDTEGEYQPPSIQVMQDDMKRMIESNVMIFFDKDDLKCEWKNEDLPKP